MSKSRRYRKRSAKAGKVVVSLFLALVLCASSGVFGYAMANGWTLKKKTETPPAAVEPEPAPAPEPEPEPTEEVLPEKTIFLSPYSLAATYAEASMTEGITKTIRVNTEPADANIIPELEYIISWDEDEDIDDYFVIEKDPDNELVAYLTCLQIFRGKTATLTVRSLDGTLSASAEVNYRGMPTEINLNFISGYSHSIIAHGGENIYEVELTNEFNDVDESCYDDITMTCIISDGSVDVISQNVSSGVDFIALFDQYVCLYEGVIYDEYYNGSSITDVSNFSKSRLNSMPATSLVKSFNRVGTKLQPVNFDPATQVRYNKSKHRLIARPDFSHTHRVYIGQKSGLHKVGGLFIGISKYVRYTITFTCGDVSKEFYPIVREISA